MIPKFCEMAYTSLKIKMNIKIVTLLTFTVRDYDVTYYPNMCHLHVGLTS